MFSQGDWIRWSTPNQVREGRVVRVAGPSLVVEWLGGEEQVFPVVEGYLPPYCGDARMERIGRPKEASRIERDTRKGRMSVARAAAILGTTPKRTRAMLRSGQLRGTKEGGKWTSVDAESVVKLSIW